MSAKENLTKSANIARTARAIDFVSRFSNEWTKLKNVLGISREVEKVPGQVLKVINASVTLQSGAVGEGEEIPYSLSEVTETPVTEATIEKYAKAVSIEAINAHGYDVAVEKTDNEFLAKLQKVVTAKFFTFLKTGTLTAIDTTFQAALAMAKGRVLDMFGAMDKECTDVCAFVNVLDFYNYVGNADITVQTAFGLQYVKDFMGYSTIFLVDSNAIPRGKVVATPVDNVVCYYINPAVSDFAKAGLEFTVDGETPLIGFHTEGDYRTLVSENTAIMGMYLFAEYLNGIAVETIEASGSLTALTVTSAAGTATGDSRITVTEALVAGGHFYLKAQASTAPTAPAYLDEFDATDWTEITSGNDYTLTNGHKFTLVEVNGAGQAIGTATGTVVSKS